MTNLTEFTFLSSDGKTRLHAMQWLPVETPRAVLQISHGVAEHIGRYDGFARYLNEQGIAVVGHDHLGHGGSLPEGGTPVYFGDGTPWETVVADIQLLHEQLRREFPGVPLCLMGHSMGSFLARSYLIRYPGTLRAAIIMGTGWQPQAKLTGGRAVAEVVCAAQGPSAASKLVNDLAFGGYNKAFAPNRTGYDWLSADSENVDRYIADPLRCHGGAVPPDAPRHRLQSEPQESGPHGQQSAGAADLRRPGPGGRYGQGRPPHRRRLPQGGPVGRDCEAVSRSETRDPQ